MRVANECQLDVGRERVVKLLRVIERRMVFVAWMELKEGGAGDTAGGGVRPGSICC